MSQRIDIERLLDHWFRDGPTEVSHRVIDTVADRIRHQPQRHAWRLLWRSIAMTRTFKTVLVVAAAVAVVLVGYAAFPRPSSSVGGTGSGPTATILTAQPTPTPAPTRTPAPTPTAAPSPTVVSWISVTPNPAATCEDALPGCTGPLPAGLHRSWHLDPRLYYTVPDGWTNSIDTGTIFKLDHGASADPYILIWSGASIADQTPNCDPVAKKGVGNLAADWLTFLTTHPGLVVSTPTEVDLPQTGGAQAWTIDVQVAPAWTATCPGRSDPEVTLIAHTTTPAAMYGVKAAERLHLMIVKSTDHLGRELALIIEVYGDGDQSVFAPRLATAQEVIGTMLFGCGPTVGYGPCGSGT
jgi:hypothetical protein